MTESGHTRLWHSACESGECVEVSFSGEGVLVRSSREPEGAILAFTRAEWRAFCAAVAKGEMLG